MAEENSPKKAVLKPRSKISMFVVCLFTGLLGIHRLLMGYTNLWIQGITIGGWFFWTIYDLIMIVIDRMPMADGTPLTKS